MGCAAGKSNTESKKVKRVGKVYEKKTLGLPLLIEAFH